MYGTVHKVLPAQQLHLAGNAVIAWGCRQHGSDMLSSACRASHRSHAYFICHPRWSVQEGGQFFWQLWELFNVNPLKPATITSGIAWSALLAQAPKLVGLFMVVCFGSCMDVAAIQSDMPFPLDFNRELMTVGKHHMGCLGACACPAIRSPQAAYGEPVRLLLRGLT